MAKDPAVLFYTSDFLVGTYSMTDAQCGQYMRLLCLQHQNGHLTDAIMHDVLHGKMDAGIVQKFKIDADGLYYNERMDAETNRRRDYVKSRSANRKPKTSSSDAADKKIICESHDEHMETATVTTINTQVIRSNGGFLTDAEADQLFQTSQQFNAVFSAAERAGFPHTQADLDRLNLIVADYGAEAVLNAIDAAVDAGVKTWRYLKGILKSDPTGGEKPREAAFTVTPHWEDER